VKILELPLSLRPNRPFPLVRLGSPRDGGYLIDERLLQSDLMSFGISGDWVFEKHWRKRNPEATIETYDGSISGRHFAITAILSFLRPHKLKLIFRNFVTALEYWTFLKKQTRFTRLFIGNRRHKSWISYDTLVRNTICKTPFFLKIDIEGHEYDILDEIICHRTLLSGLAIEFHQPISNLKVIENFVSQLGLAICSVHPNNCLPKYHSTVEPSLEISFSINRGLNGEPEIPHVLEQDNDESCEPIRLSFIEKS
jgi:hypothetical protein